MHVQTPDFTQLRDRAFRHIRALSGEIGPRPSAGGPGLQEAVAYVTQVLEQAGVADIERQTFPAGKHTYWPYVLALAAGALGNLLFLRRPSRGIAAAAGLLNLAGAQAFFAQSDFEDNWARRLLPKGQGINLIARIPAADTPKHHLVLMAHLDTHKTPLAYSQPILLRLFSVLVGTGWLSLLGSGLVHLVHLLGKRKHRGLIGLALALQTAVGLMAAEGETQPYTPGANDNASGAGVVLALAEHLARHPLPETEVWVVFTDCEEVGAYGVQAFLQRYGDRLHTAYILNFDMVGMGTPALQSADGLIRRYFVHPELWARAVEVVAEHPQWRICPYTGAYTDATVATKHGFRAVTITTLLPKGHPAEPYMGYWHQLSDRLENIEPETLESVLRLGWALMLRLTREP